MRPGSGGHFRRFFSYTYIHCILIDFTGAAINVEFTNAGNFWFSGQEIDFGDAAQQTGANAVTDLDGGTLALLGNDKTFHLTAGELTGAAGGVILGDLANNGLVDFGSGFGVLTVEGDYTQTATATLRLNIGGPSRFDSLDITVGRANLGGHLQIQGSPGGAAFQILQAVGGVAGAFSDVTGGWTPVYGADQVWVQGGHT
jgi:hypothetical protein